MSSIQDWTSNVSNCYVNLTNKFHVAVHLINSRSQLTTKCGKKQKNHVALTWQSLRAAIGPLQFSLHHWNLRNLTLHSGILPYKSLEIFSAYTVLSHGSIMLPPHQPRVFARLARWQLFGIAAASIVFHCKSQYLLLKLLFWFWVSSSLHCILRDNCYTTTGGGEGVTTLTRLVLGEGHSSSRNLEISSGIRRLCKFLGKHDIFQGHDGKKSDHLAQHF